MERTHTAIGRLAATAALTVLLLSACAAGSESKSAATVPAVADAPADLSGPSLTGGDSAAETQVTAPATGELPNNVLAPDGRKLVVVMTVGLEVTDAASAVDAVIELAAAHGGQLYDSGLDLTDPATAAGDLVFKLPPEEVDGFLRGLDPGIGRRTALRGTTSDVTTQLSDLDAQILTARKSVERVRALLDAAGNLGEVITLEGELTTRETHLEQLLAQQSGLNDQVAMATVTVHLTTAAADAAAPAPREPDTGIGAAFRSGWRTFVDALSAIARFVGHTAPFLVIAMLVVVAGWRIGRRRPRPSGPATAGTEPRSRSAAPPPPPAPDADPHTSTPDSAVAARSL